jgi:hypothetical protein
MYIFIHCAAFTLHDTESRQFDINITYETESQQLYIKYHLQNKINHQQVYKE